MAAALASYGPGLTNGTGALFSVGLLSLDVIYSVFISALLPNTFKNTRNRNPVLILKNRPFLQDLVSPGTVRNYEVNIFDYIGIEDVLILGGF